MPSSSSDVATVLNRSTAFRHFATFSGTTHSQRHVKPLHDYVAAPARPRGRPSILTTCCRAYHCECGTSVGRNRLVQSTMPCGNAFGRTRMSGHTRPR